MQNTLTDKQQEFYDYLQKEIAGTGVSPSLRTAAKDLGISHTAVASMLRTLEDKGRLKREGRYSRTIHLLNQEKCSGRGQEAKSVPIIGEVAAGLPLYAQQEWAGHLLVDPDVYRGSNLFALKVQGDSMRDAGILDGDLVICEPRQFAENGEIVVALVQDEEATVKRFFYQGDHIELRPENEAFPILQYSLGEVLIQGKVIGLQRGPEQYASKKK